MMMWCLFMIFLLNPECDTLRSAEQFKCEWREVQFIKTQRTVAATCIAVDFNALQKCKAIIREVNRLQCTIYFREFQRRMLYSELQESVLHCTSEVGTQLLMGTPRYTEVH